MTNLLSSTNTWYYKAPETDGTWNLVFPDGQREILVRVLPENTTANRHTIESEMAVFHLATNSTYAVAPPAPWTTPGPIDNSVAVTLWDGPKYWMYDLAAYHYFECGGDPIESMQEEGEPPPVLIDAEDPAGEDGGAEAAQGEVDATVGPAPPGWIQTRTGDWIAVETEVGTATGEIIEPLEAVPEGSEEVGGEAELDSTICCLAGYGNTAYGINSFQANGQLVPVIAGSAFFNNTGYPQLPQPYFQLAGSWQSPEYSAFRAVSTPGSSGVMRDVDNFNSMVGELDGNACYIEGATVYSLRRFVDTQGGSAAYALSSESGYAVGWGRSNNVTRAARWDVLNLNARPQDLDPNNPTRPGAAHGVNSNGVTVGKVQRTKDNVNVWRAFRWNGSLVELNLPEDTNVTLYNNTANDVTASGHAVGVTDSVFKRGTEQRETRACVWWAGTNGPVLLGTVGWTDSDPWHVPGSSEALGAIETGATNKLLVVGTGWITPSSPAYRRAYRQVVIRNPNSFDTTPDEAFDLNDPMWSVVPGGWTLVTGEDVNSMEWIVGSGFDGSGQTRGYVLVPQTP